MKTTFRIAKNELRTLFYSPIAWFLLVVFLFDYGLIYTSGISAVKTRQELGGPMLKYLTNLTQGILGANNGLFSQVLIRIFLYIPLLTMGLMSRETGSGTIKLLYSSPIKVRQIIFGKFMAMMLFSLLMVLVLCIFVVCGLFNIRDVDAGPLLAGLLSIYLLLCTYSAIGLFMSCLTTYQVVGAVSTLIMLAFLSYVGSLWQDIDFVRDLTFFLSISGRAAHMMRGLLTTKDILYFVLISGMFLGLSIYKLKAERETRVLWVRWSRYGGIVVSTVLLGYIFSRPWLVGYVDTTATKSQTLSAPGQEILGQMKEGPLEVTSYINLLDPLYQHGRPEERNSDLQRWELYQRFKSDMKIKYVYYYDSSSNHFLFAEGKSMKELAEKYAKTYKTSLSRFETPEEIRKEIDLRPEMNRYVMQLKYGGRTTFLRMFDDMIRYPSESEVLAAMKRLVTSPPKIAFITGELERNVNQSGDRQYKVLTNEKGFRKSLVNQGFDVISLSLQDQDIPADIAGLVLADPITQLDTSAQRKLERYIAAGGNLLVAGEPGRQEIVNPLLKVLGVQLMDGVLVQQSTQFSPDLVQGELASAGKSLSKNLQRDAGDSMVVSLSGAVGLSYDNNGAFDIQPLIVTNGKSTWSKKRKFNPDMIDKIEAPFAGQAVPAQLSAVSGVPGEGANGKGAMDLNRIRANLKVLSASEAKVQGALPQAGAAGQKAAASLSDSAGARSPKAVMAATSREAAPATATTPATASTPAGTASNSSAAQNTTMAPMQPRAISMPAGGRSLKDIVDSIRAANNGKIRTATTATTTSIASVSTSSAKTSSAAPATTTMALTPTEGHAIHPDSVGTGKTGISTIADARMPVSALKIKGMIPMKGFVFSKKKAAPPLPVKQAGQPARENDKPMDLAFSAADGDVRGTLPVALRLTRHINGREQRIVVVGDADFLSNVELNRSNLQTCNFDFATSVFGWFSYGKFPVDVVRPEPKDNRVTVSDQGILIMKIIFLGVLPAIVALLGTILLIRRRRK